MGHLVQKVAQILMAAAVLFITLAQNHFALQAAPHVRSMSALASRQIGRPAGLVMGATLSTLQLQGFTGGSRQNGIQIIG
jgi:hypothetical protein